MKMFNEQFDSHQAELFSPLIWSLLTKIMIN